MSKSKLDDLHDTLVCACAQSDPSKGVEDRSLFCYRAVEIVAALKELHIARCQRDVLRRWVRRWERWSHQGVEASDGAFVPDTAVVPGSELRAASAGDPPPMAKR